VRPAELAAVAAVVQTAVVAAALVFAWFQLRETSATRRDQSRAYVVAYVSTEPELREFPNLVVANLGTTAAYDITLATDRPLRSSLDDTTSSPLRDVGMLNSGIPTLVPGQRVSTLFDTMLQRPQEWETTYRFKVRYRDRFDESPDDVFTLDLESRRGSLAIDELGLRSISKQLQKLVKEVHELRTGWGGPLQVVVEDRAVRHERVRVEAEELRRHREERAGEGGPRPFGTTSSA
jgi:hypothetical protein